ncbi:MAG TPA: hypothetical protein VM327_07760 [Candidatus Thermoplasmatota archaeon]|nr:hypothetical protein [Candidatus Thermoplasmatota archaeon]
MRAPVPMTTLLAVFLLAGCFDGGPTEDNAVAAISDCRMQPPLEQRLYLGPALGLQPGLPPDGYAKGNSFSGGFLTDDLKEWLSPAQTTGLWLVGNVTLDYWVRSTGTPAPIALPRDPSDPSAYGQGYHFFNQFGSDRTFQPAAAIEYSDAVPQEGAIDHYTETLALEPGGFVIEPGDRIRLLLTDLALDGAGGGGHDVLFGPEHPSFVAYTARCWPELLWRPSEVLLDEPVSLPANQGLLFGGRLQGRQANAANQARFELVVPPGTTRLRFDLMQEDDRNPVKDDVDITLLDRAGAAAWSIGSPYSDESGTLWVDNLDAKFPTGELKVQIDSYSAVAYTGRLTVTRDVALAH